MIVLGEPMAPPSPTRAICAQERAEILVNDVWQRVQAIPTVGDALDAAPVGVKESLDRDLIGLARAALDAHKAEPNPYAVENIVGVPV